MISGKRKPLTAAAEYDSAAVCQGFFQPEHHLPSVALAALNIRKESVFPDQIADNFGSLNDNGREQRKKSDQTKLCSCQRSN